MLDSGEPGQVRPISMRSVPRGAFGRSGLALVELRDEGLASVGCRAWAQRAGVVDALDQRLFQGARSKRAASDDTR